MNLIKEQIAHENIFDNFTKEFVDDLNHQLDVAILECLTKNKLNPREVVLLLPLCKIKYVFD